MLFYRWRDRLDWPGDGSGNTSRAGRKRTACAMSRAAGVTALIELKRGRTTQPGELS
jgi:hypothetical protein